MAFLMALIAGLAHANLVIAQRLAARQVQAARAAEAADAGLDWTLARLNAPQPVDDACEPAPASSGTGFRDRHLPPLAEHGMPTPDPALQPACTATRDGWRCACPMAGAAPVHDPGGIEPVPAFRVRLEPHAAPGLLSLRSTGCSDIALACLAPAATSLPGADDASDRESSPAAGRAEARAERSLDLAFLPALSHLPAAALTVHGRVDLGNAPWQLSSAAPPHGGLALHAGGSVRAPALVVHAAPGAPRSSARLAPDAALSAPPLPHRFAQLFRLGHAGWQALPTVHRIDCHVPCDAAVSKAVSADEGFQLLWLEGGLRLSTTATLGRGDHPVLLVSNGPVELLAPVEIHGLVYTTASAWRDDAGASVHGAVVAQGDLLASGATHIHHDPAVLQALARAGTFVRVPGSWKDFP